MSTKKWLGLALLVLLTPVTIFAGATVGYMGVINHQLADPGGWQVLTDLVCALILVTSWMILDARQAGRTVWPYIVLTIVMGSYGPIAYLLLSPARQPQLGNA